MVVRVRAAARAVLCAVLADTTGFHRQDHVAPRARHHHGTVTHLAATSPLCSPLIAFLLAQGLLFLQIDNDQEGATQRAAAIYFSLIICNLISFGTTPQYQSCC
jgi:hypothetical protein